MSRSRRTAALRRLVLLWWWFGGVVPARPAELLPGNHQLRVEHGLIYLTAREAPLAAVLADLEQALGADIRIPRGANQPVSGDYPGVSIDRFLDGLGLDYLLFYQRDGDTGVDRLLGAAMSRPGGQPVDAERNRRIASLIANLADDGVRGNALDSASELEQIGAPAIPSLERALREGDHQTRQLAAGVLRRLGASYAPSRSFLEVLVEGLAHDQYPYANTFNPETGRTEVRRMQAYLHNAAGGLDYFRRADPAVREQAMPMLVDALDSEDGQQRFLAALLVAEHGAVHYANRAAPILIAHLADNQLSTDAAQAAPALLQLGPSARPYLERIALEGDAQQAEIARSILADLNQPIPPRIRPPRLLTMVDWLPESFPDRDGTYRLPPPVRNDPFAGGLDPPSPSNPDPAHAAAQPARPPSASRPRHDPNDE